MIGLYSLLHIAFTFSGIYLLIFYEYVMNNKYLF